MLHGQQTGSGNAEVVFKLETIGYDSLHGVKEKRQNRLYLLSLPNSNYLNPDLSGVFFIHDHVFSLFEMLFAIIYKALLKLFLFRIWSFIG